MDFISHIKSDNESGRLTEMMACSKNQAKAGTIRRLNLLRRNVKLFVILSFAGLINQPLISIKRGMLKDISIEFPHKKFGQVCPEIHCALCDHVTKKMAINLQMSGYRNRCFIC